MRARRKHIFLISASWILLASFPSFVFAGTVIGWGETNSNISTPCATDVVSIAAGNAHSLLLKSDGTVAQCGSTAVGNVPPGLSNVIAVAAADTHSVALRANGTVIAWGVGNDGLTNVPPDLTNVVAISAGSKHSLALRADGSVVAWGTSATNIPAGLSNIVAVTAGRGNTLVLKADGTVDGWGNGQGGVDLTILSNIVAISAADNCCYDVALALRSDGKVIRIRGPSYGGIVTLLSNVVAISASRGTDHHINLALKSDGTVIPVLGFNFYKVAYCTPFSFPSCPFPDVPPGLSNVIAVASGDQHNLALVGTNLPMTLANSVLDNNGFRVTVPTQNGRVYRLEFRDLLTAGDWFGLPLIAGNGSLQVLSDPTANNVQRFYRVRRW